MGKHIVSKYEHKNVSAKYEHKNVSAKYEHKNVSAKCERKIRAQNRFEQSSKKGALVTPFPILLMLHSTPMLYKRVPKVVSLGQIFTSEFSNQIQFPLDAQKIVIPLYSYFISCRSFRLWVLGMCFISCSWFSLARSISLILC